MSGLKGKNFYELDAIVHARRNGGGEDYTIIDVRDADERLSEGAIPTSINIPANELKSAMKMRSTAFEKKYGVRKPTKKDKIILYCRTSQRSTFSAIYLVNEKYEQVFYLVGGHEEWLKHERNVDHADL